MNCSLEVMKWGNQCSDLRLESIYGVNWIFKHLRQKDTLGSRYLGGKFKGLIISRHTLPRIFLNDLKWVMSVERAYPQPFTSQIRPCSLAA